MTPDPDDAYEVFRGPWAVEVGRFVLAFGSIEGMTYSALRQIPHDPIAESLIEANLALKPRLKLLMKIAESRDGVRWQQFAETLGKVHALAGKRNLIAHNSVGFDVFVDASGEISFHQLAISNAKKKKAWGKQHDPQDRVLFDELVAHRLEAESLASELTSRLFGVFELVGAEKYDDQKFIAARKDLAK